MSRYFVACTCRALLTSFTGSPIGATVGFLLLQHEVTLGDKQVLDITIFRDVSEVEQASVMLLFAIEDIPPELEISPTPLPNPELIPALPPRPPGPLLSGIDTTPNSLLAHTGSSVQRNLLRVHMLQCQSLRSGDKGSGVHDWPRVDNSSGKSMKSELKTEDLHARAVLCHIGPSLPH